MDDVVLPKIMAAEHKSRALINGSKLIINITIMANFINFSLLYNLKPAKGVIAVVGQNINLPLS